MSEDVVFTRGVESFDLCVVLGIADRALRGGIPSQQEARGLRASFKNVHDAIVRAGCLPPGEHPGGFVAPHEHPPNAPDADVLRLVPQELLDATAAAPGWQQIDTYLRRYNALVRLLREWEQTAKLHNDTPMLIAIGRAKTALRAEDRNHE